PYLVLTSFRNAHYPLSPPGERARVRGRLTPDTSAPINPWPVMFALLLRNQIFHTVTLHVHIREEPRAQITFRRRRHNDHDLLARVLGTLRHLQRRPDQIGRAHV